MIRTSFVRTVQEREEDAACPCSPRGGGVRHAGRGRLAGFLLLLLGPGLLVGWPLRTSAVPPAARPGAGGTDGRGAAPPPHDRWRAPPGAPNVLLILLDDVGFGQPGTFGGPIPTPSLDRLARLGLRYNRFHTAGLCAPTRAALLTGRNQHAVGMGTSPELARSDPGYDARLPRSAATVAEVLRRHGYATAAFGKWLLTPEQETGPLGPFDRWPGGLGFEHFYGFHGVRTSQWTPQLYENNVAVEPPRTPEQGYHLTRDLVDRAIGWLRLVRAQAPERPFFVYFATGAAAAPHQPPEHWAARFRGKFDRGWDRLREMTFTRQRQLGVVPEGTRLTRRPAEIQAWDSLSAEEQRAAARMQELFAGYLAHTDHELGRLLDALDELGVRDDTLVIFIAGDHGPSGEGTLNGTSNSMASLQDAREDLRQLLAVLDVLGGPRYDNHYPAGWAWAGATPFQWFKQIASHFGATRNGLVISWPRRIEAQGGLHAPATLRSQLHHVVDIVPTIYEAVGIRPPDVLDGVRQQPLDGVSMVYTFDPAGALSPGRRRTQYFEVFGNRAIYEDGWVAAARRGGLPWAPGEAGSSGQDRWELYHVDEDFSQAVDLAVREPERLARLQRLFEREAKKYAVFPLVDPFAGLADPGGWPGPAAGRTVFTYHGPARRIPESCAPCEKGRSYRISASLSIPPGGAEGVLVTSGGRTGGYALFLAGGRLVFTYSYFGRELTSIRSAVTVPPGEDVQVGFEFQADRPRPGTGGTGRLYIQGQLVGEQRIPRTIPARNTASETFDVGQDTGTPASDEYEVPFRFTGTLRRLTFQYLP